MSSSSPRSREGRTIVTLAPEMNTAGRSSIASSPPAFSFARATPPETTPPSWTHAAVACEGSRISTTPCRLWPAAIRQWSARRSTATEPGAASSSTDITSPTPSLRIASRGEGHDHIMLVTDAMSVTGTDLTQFRICTDAPSSAGTEDSRQRMGRWRVRISIWRAPFAIRSDRLGIRAPRGLAHGLAQSRDVSRGSITSWAGSLLAIAPTWFCSTMM